MNDLDLFGDTGPALATLAAEINAEHDAAERTARKAIGHVRAAGDRLLLAKAQVEHGQWLPWLATNCPAIADGATPIEAATQLEPAFGLSA